MSLATRETAAVLIFCPKSLNSYNYEHKNRYTQKGTHQTDQLSKDGRSTSSSASRIPIIGRCQHSRQKIKATNFSTGNNVVFQFDDEEFSLSLDLVRKGGVQ